MSKKEKRVTLIRFDQRRIRRLQPLARLVSGLLPWCGPLSLLAGCTAMALARLSLRQLLLQLCMTELLVALALALPGIAATTCRSKRKLPHCFLCGSFCFFSAAPLRAPTVPFRLILPPQKAVFARRICGRSAARLSREWLPVLPKGRTIPEKKASEHRSGHLFYCFLPFLQCFL